MKTIQIGDYSLSLKPIGARVWFTVSLGKLQLIKKHERNSHKAFMKGLDNIEKLVNV